VFSVLVFIFHLEVKPVVSPSKVSLVICLPVLAAYLIPAIFLLPVGVTFSLLAIFDPTVTFTQALSYDLWIIVLIAAAAVVFFVGRGLVSFYQRGLSPRVIVIAIWGLFTVTLFFALWFGVIILTSIGASETPPYIFLRITGLGAVGLTLAGQVFVIPWLFFTCRKLLPMKTEVGDAKQ
jgi:hypothetical protein